MNKWLLIYLFFIALGASSQRVNEMIQKGNVFYKQQQFEKATAEYKKVLETEPGNNTAKFNLANSLQKQGKEDEAIILLTEVAASTKEEDLKSHAFYNKGVIFSGQKKLEESIDAYKEALRKNSGDNDARENLQKALMELKKKNPAKKENQQQQKKKEQDQQQKKQQQPKMSEKEAEQRLKLLQQKEKEVQQRLQKEKNKGGGSQVKDW
jgi:Ca-activated chloride channel family protein